MYCTPPTTQPVREAIKAGRLAAINTPAQSYRMDGLPVWAADNSCGPGKNGIGGGYPGDVPFIRWLARQQPHASRCLFAVAPDVVADAKATLKRSRPFLEIIRALGYPAAFAAQNGLEKLRVPWDEFDVLFLGGDDAFKLGPHARDLTGQAHALGKPVHMGRVNSLRRLRYASAMTVDGSIFCETADGTYISQGPNENLPKALAWLRAVNDQEALWGAAS